MCHGSKRCRDQETSLGLTAPGTTNIKDHLTLRNTHSSEESHLLRVHSKIAFCGGGAEVAVERANPTCTRPQPQYGPSRRTTEGLECKPVSCNRGRRERSYLRTPDIRRAPPYRLRRSLRLPGSPNAAGLGSGHYLAMQPLPQQPRADRTLTTTYPPCPAQDSPGSF